MYICVCVCGLAVYLNNFKFVCLYLFTRTHHFVNLFQAQTSGVRSMTFNPDGRTLLCGLHESLKVAFSVDINVAIVILSTDLSCFYPVLY